MKLRMSDPYNPKVDVSYDVDKFEQDVYKLIGELQDLVKNESNKKEIVEEHEYKLKKTYKAVYKRSEKLYTLALDYIKEDRDIREFQDIFKTYIKEIKNLNKNPNINYIKTSESIGKYVGKKFGLPES